MKCSWEVMEDVSAAAAYDHHVACSRRLADHVLGDLEHGSAGVEDGVDVGWVPRCGFGWDHRLAAGGTKRHEEAVEQRAWLLVLCLDLFLRELEPVRDLVDDPGLQEVDLQLA